MRRCSLILRTARLVRSASSSEQLGFERVEGVSDPTGRLQVLQSQRALGRALTRSLLPGAVFGHAGVPPDAT